MKDNRYKTQYNGKSSVVLLPRQMIWMHKYDIKRSRFVRDAIEEKIKSMDPNYPDDVAAEL